MGGELISPGHVQRGFGSDPLFRQRLDPFQFAFGDFEAADGLAEVGARDGEFGFSLGHGLDVFFVIEFRHDLAARDGICQIDGEPFDASRNLGRNDKGAGGFEGAAEGAAELNRAVFDRGDLDRSGAGQFVRGSGSGVAQSVGEDPGEPGGEERCCQGCDGSCCFSHFYCWMQSTGVLVTEKDPHASGGCSSRCRAGPAGVSEACRRFTNFCCRCNGSLHAGSTFRSPARERPATFCCICSKSCTASSGRGWAKLFVFSAGALVG